MAQPAPKETSNKPSWYQRFGEFLKNHYIKIGLAAGILAPTIIAFAAPALAMAIVTAIAPYMLPLLVFAGAVAAITGLFTLIGKALTYDKTELVTREEVGDMIDEGHAAHSYDRIANTLDANATPGCHTEELPDRAPQESHDNAGTLNPIGGGGGGDAYTPPPAATAPAPAPATL